MAPAWFFLPEMEAKVVTLVPTRSPGGWGGAGAAPLPRQAAGAPRSQHFAPSIPGLWAPGHNSMALSALTHFMGKKGFSPGPWAWRPPLRSPAWVVPCGSLGGGCAWAGVTPGSRGPFGRRRHSCAAQPPAASPPPPGQGSGAQSQDPKEVVPPLLSPGCPGPGPAGQSDVRREQRSRQGHSTLTCPSRVSPPGPALAPAASLCGLVGSSRQPETLHD